MLNYLFRGTLFFLAFPFAGIQFISAQGNFPPPDHPIPIEAIRVHGKITLDGKLDEPEWKNAPLIGDFIEYEPIQGKKPQFQTEVKLLFDSTNLYIGAFLKDSFESRSDLRVPDLGRDFDVQNNDVFGFRLDSFNGKRNCLAFDTNPYGVQRDAQIFDSQIFEINWNALWKVKTRITKNGWYAEFAIPFTSIRYPKNSNSLPPKWNIIFLRVKRSINEISTFPALPRSVSFSRMSYGAEITGLDLPNPTGNIQVQPYGLYINDRKTINTTQSLNSKPKVGVDVKWAYNTHGQLDFTLNPDFAQADIDKPVINLGRSAISLPEKRQFFLDNSGLFSVGVVGTVFRSTFFQPFYSRTIGLNSEGLPQSIQGGIRLVDRTLKRTIGGILLRQEGFDSIRGTDFTVARFQKNFGKEDNLGFLFTNKYEEPSRAGIAHVSNSNLTFNGLNRFSNQFGMTYLVSGTQELLDHSRGLAGSLRLDYNSNNLSVNTEHHFVSPNYNPALGFLSRQGVIYNAFSIQPKFRSTKLPSAVREVSPGLFLDIYNDSKTHQLQEVDLNINPISIDFTNGASLFLVNSYNYQNLTDTFSPLHIKIIPGIYQFWNHSLNFQSDLSKPLSVQYSGSIGNYFNAFQWDTNFTIRYSPDPHFNIMVNLDHNIFKHIGSRNQNITTNLLVVTSQAYYSPKFFFTGLLEYNSLNNILSYNTKITWEYTPLSFIYLVLTNLKDQYNHYQERQIISKISFIKQF